MDQQENITAPHGVQQNIKMDLLGMIHNGEDPFAIIYRLAKYFEEASAEAGYADIVKENLRSIYGVALGNKKLLADELEEVLAREEKLKSAFARKDESDEVKKRIEFALIRHQKRADQLRLLLKEDE